MWRVKESDLTGIKNKLSSQSIHISNLQILLLEAASSEILYTSVFLQICIKKIDLSMMNPCISLTLLVHGLDYTVQWNDFPSVDGLTRISIFFVVEYHVSSATGGEMVLFHTIEDFVLLKINSLIFAVVVLINAL